jgi:hypothetical protein
VPASRPHVAPSAGATLSHSTGHSIPTGVSEPHAVCPQSWSKRSTVSNVVPWSADRPIEKPAFFQSEQA